MNHGNAAKSKPLLNKSVISLQPVLVSQVDKYLNLDIWSPKAFGEEFGEFCYNDTSINILYFFTSSSSLRCGPVYVNSVIHQLNENPSRTAGCHGVISSARFVT